MKRTRTSTSRRAIRAPGETAPKTGRAGGRGAPPAKALAAPKKGANLLKVVPEKAPAGKHALLLFVAGATVRSRQAILRVRQLCAADLKNACKLKVIDIYQQPALARAHQIVATPTLIVEFPPPLRRFIGDLANITGLVIELDLLEKGRIPV